MVADIEMNRPIPFGVLGEFPPIDGIAPYGGFRIPGPTTVPFSDPRASTATDGESDAKSPGGEPQNIDFAVGGDRYRLRQTGAGMDARRLWSAQAVVIAPHEAGAILERAIAQHRYNADLVRRLERAGSQLAGLHPDGTFVLIWFRPHEERVIVPAPAAAASRPRSAPAAAPAPATEAPMAPVQAAVLRSAAASGVPFCEECARAAAARA